ncbi:MAG: 50S ribosomal protein L11 methyltransferase [Azospirillaceae bacterium]|nr:50S ribosomal protein L11 methyltransferase [Azospirillaceae bacterium]
MPKPEIWRVALAIPEPAVAAFTEAIGDGAAAVSTFELDEGGDWLLEATFRTEPNRGVLESRAAVVAKALGLIEPQLAIEALPPIDWLSHSYQSFPPIRAGRYFIYGSHHEGGHPAGSIGLLIDAATAFGTGEHETTKGCLLAIDRLTRGPRPRRVLDMGCGSGILALAMAKSWRIPVVAVDLDEESVRVARHNARVNALTPWLTIGGGDGYRAAVVARGSPYDIITANILARPLARMAPALRHHLRRGGRAILSGLLARQERHVLAAHQAQGLSLESRIAIGEWRTLVLRG